jgi:hypothetical protein
MCHDYFGIPGVKRGVDEAIATGFFDFMGLFAGSVLLRASPRCSGVVQGLKHRTFEQIRDALLARYQAPDITTTSNVDHEANRKITYAAREELRTGSDIRGSSGRGQWPYVRPEGDPLPTTLPDGRPWPKISIVTPSLNQGQFIERTILSVLNQNYPNIEHIVMDGGSIDETRTILPRYSQRVRVVSEKDSGQSNAINKGMRLCTGELLTWLNSDDMFAPDALAGMAMAFYSSGADMVAGVCQVQKDGEVLNRHMTTCGDGPLPIDGLLDLEGIWQQGQYFYQPEVMFTRALWNEPAGASTNRSIIRWITSCGSASPSRAPNCTRSAEPSPSLAFIPSENQPGGRFPAGTAEGARRIFRPHRAQRAKAAAGADEEAVAHRLLQRSGMGRRGGNRPSSHGVVAGIGRLRCHSRGDFSGCLAGAAFE